MSLSCTVPAHRSLPYRQADIDDTIEAIRGNNKLEALEPLEALEALEPLEALEALCSSKHQLGAWSKHGDSDLVRAYTIHA